MTDVNSVLEAMVTAQQHDGEAWAFAVGKAGRWASPHYWQDELQRRVFETFVGHECLELRDLRVVFVTPVTVCDADGRLDFRNPTEPLRAGDREELFGLAIDAKQGFDVLRCQITRDPEGAPIFGDIEIFEGQLQLVPTTPGYTLLQTLLQAI